MPIRTDQNLQPKPLGRLAEEGLEPASIWIVGAKGQQVQLAGELANVLGVPWQTHNVDAQLEAKLQYSAPKLLVVCGDNTELPQVNVPQVFLSQHDPPRSFHLPADAELIAQVFTAAGRLSEPGANGGSAAGSNRRIIFVINNGPALTTHKFARDLAAAGMAAFLDLGDTQTHVETLKLLPRHRKSSESRWRWCQIQAHDPPLTIPTESSLVVAAEKNEGVEVDDPRVEAMLKLLSRAVVHCPVLTQPLRDLQEKLGAYCVVVSGNRQQDAKRLAGLLRRISPGATLVLTARRPRTKMFQTLTRYRVSSEVLQVRSGSKGRKRQINSLWSKYENASKTRYGQRDPSGQSVDAQKPRWRQLCSDGGSAAFGAL